MNVWTVVDGDIFDFSTAVDGQRVLVTQDNTLLIEILDAVGELIWVPRTVLGETPFVLEAGYGYTLYPSKQTVSKSLLKPKS